MTVNMHITYFFGWLIIVEDEGEGEGDGEVRMRVRVRIRVSGDQHEDDEENDDDDGVDQSSSVTKLFAAISESLFTIY